MTELLYEPNACPIVDFCTAGLDFFFQIIYISRLSAQFLFANLLPAYVDS